MSLRLPPQDVQPFNVVAFDPGGTTGWAQAICLVANPHSLDDIGLYTGEFGPKEHHDDLFQELVYWAHYASVEEFPVPEVVSEPFHYRQNVVGEGAAGFRGKVELISAEYIGVIKLACAQLGLSYYDRFTPGEAKRYCPNSKLAALGWLQTPTTAMRHRNDALRQLVKYLIVKKKVRHPITTSWRQEQK